MSSLTALHPPVAPLQLALLSNRTVVFPDVPCRTRWAHNSDDMSGCEDSTKVGRCWAVAGV